MIENEDVKILWDMKIQADHVIEYSRHDIVVLDKKERKHVIIDFM